MVGAVRRMGRLLLRSEGVEEVEAANHSVRLLKVAGSGGEGRRAAAVRAREEEGPAREEGEAVLQMQAAARYRSTLHERR